MAGERGAKPVTVLDAPSNLGLTPPTAGAVPGCAKAPGALRDHDLLARLDAHDAGCVVPPRYDPGDWAPGDGVNQADQVADYAVRLAERLAMLLAGDAFPVVLGGDCSILLGSALALRRRGAEDGTRYGLVFIDGHTDFRHPGNADYVGAAGGEELALVTGRGDARLTNIDGLKPYLRESDIVVLGIRDDDAYRMDITAAGIPHRTVPVLRAEGMPRTAAWAASLLSDTAGFWVHLDTDVLDPTVLPAVDAPSDGGIGYGELEHLVADLVAVPGCLGIEVTVFDPDYDPDGRFAGELVDALVAGLRPRWDRPAVPDGPAESEPADPAGRSAPIAAGSGPRHATITVALAAPPAADTEGAVARRSTGLGWPPDDPSAESAAGTSSRLGWPE
ncbi:arginase family protein [Actinocatenispora sera]|uniref:arginase family protein n=1 Tax=Actinocatenispora sera TaxID=390989 RepID=UPI0033D2B5C1